MSPLDLDVTWNTATSGAPEPAFQVHWADEATVVLRQSITSHFEAPFLYLLLGTERALLLDTGATGDDVARSLRSIVDGLVDEWLRVHPRPGYGLVVAHSHAHDDHVAGDGQFDDRPDTVVVGHDVAAVRSFFGIDAQGAGGRLDLGGRVVEVVAIPGHHRTSVAVHDPATRALLTGDTVYPGRLYVDDFPAFCASLQRLRELVRTRSVEHLLGAHVEMSDVAGVDHPRGSVRHDGEAPLPMTPAHLDDVAAAAAATGGAPGRHVFDDFVLCIE
ncbi:MBL fold metallo-hydrolase [Kineococcus rhizosphaerae]|uniref:Glyoxylase-like metal-dependent hydrolase (Beta-lactamase superfamily II) n=1 Tax=Kineococcus rhizosphaerae TaxID=559628 RepID=A0A2T0R005_9ACTN|nr:MBL fold metallo-hydrolase [Kineococcus rhizosphaerae]PRY12205.1 glyoxylase-like metal-dependent hydrolase (beta-lactamase superfamily II) [Kineococcus rhizosphaerae]